MKDQNFKVVISFFCIWLTGYFSAEFQLISAFILIMSFGILHGANDIVLLRKLKKKNDNFQLLRSIFSYVSVVLCTVLIFYVFPQIALLIFVLISAFHFGEQHWTKIISLKKKVVKEIFAFIYGFFILFLLFFLHQNEVTDIVFRIIGFRTSKFLIEIPFYIATFLLILTGVFLLLEDPVFKSKLAREIFYLIVFALIFKTATLLWGFAIYFIFWHSIPSMVDQVQYLYGNWTGRNFIKYCKSAFWFWVISIFGISLLYFTFKDEKVFEAMFFSFLAAITVPHVWVIIRIFGNTRNKNGIKN